jgi:hypothetical protein
MDHFLFPVTPKVKFNGNSNRKGDNAHEGNYQK